MGVEESGLARQWESVGQVWTWAVQASVLGEQALAWEAQASASEAGVSLQGPLGWQSVSLSPGHSRPPRAETDQTP
jgi:hypothetical protein